MQLNDSVIAQIREQSLLQEQQRKSSDLALQHIYEHGWFKLFVPQELGGHMASLCEAIRIIEYASWVDGSLGWAIAIGAGGGFFVPFMQSHIATALFSDPKAVVAGSGAATGTARKTEGGYIINGAWKYCSGATYATLFTANCVIEDDSNLLEEEPKVRAFAFLPDQVKIISDWQAFGLKGTESHSITISNQFVPEDRMFNLLDQLTYKEEALYRYPFLPFAQASFAAVALGICRHFLEQAAKMTMEKQETIPTNRYEAVMNRISHASNRLNDSANGFFEGVEHSWEALEKNELSLEKEAEVSKLCQHASRIALECANNVFPYLGLAVTMEHTPINQIWRDLQTACHHAVLVDHEA